MLTSDLPRVLTAEDAARWGVTAGRIRTELRHRRWRRLAASVLLTRPDDPTRYDWINAGIALGGPSAVLSGWDAVRWRGFGARRPPSQRVLILARSGRNRDVGCVHVRPSARPVAYAEASPLDEHLPGVRIAHPARSIADTALLHASFAAVRAMVTTSVQRGLVTPEQFALELARSPRQGSGFLRRAVADVVGGARSIAEAEAVDLLREVGVTGFLVNAPVLDAAGRLIYTADMLWPELRMIVEIDSREFHFGEDDWKRTMQRHNRLTRLGYAVSHYPPSEVRRLQRQWALAVRDDLLARAAELGVARPTG